MGDRSGKGLGMARWLDFVGNVDLVWFVRFVRFTPNKPINQFNTYDPFRQNMNARRINYPHPRFFQQ